MAKASNFGPALNVPDEECSYFDGGFWGLFGHLFLVGFVSLITLGIAFPWMCCYLQRWKAKHTVVCGKRMYFDGTGLQLIGNYLLWSFLTVITFGIYGLWMAIAIKKWVIKHTHYEGEKDNNSYFDGGIGGFIVMNILCFVITFFTLGIGKAWADKKKIEWRKKHTVIDSRRHIFVGTGGNLFGKYLLWGFLSCITFGIFSLWIPIKLEKWEAAYTIDNEHTTDALIKRGEYRSSVSAQAANHHAQRVQDEIELVKSGITAATDQESLLAIAQRGNRAAQYEYILRYSEKKYNEEPYFSFLKNSAAAGYAPAINLYGLSGFAGEDATDILSGAAQKGQIESALAIMRIFAKNGLSARSDAEALPFLEQAVRWYDTLKADSLELSIEDTQTNEACLMAIRRIKAKPPIRKTGAGTIIGLIALILAVIVAIILAVGAAVTFLNRSNIMDTGSGSMVHPGLSAILNSNAFGKAHIDKEVFGDEYSGDVYNDIAEEQMAAAVPDDDYADPPVETATISEGVVLSNLTYDDFMAALRANLEGDPNYYEITFCDSTDRGEYYTLTCNHWYWSSYFDLYVKAYDGYVASIELDGPRCYEEIDENINGQEFQFLLKRLYEVLGIGPDGEAGGVFIKIDPGTNGMQPFEGWDYNHNHTEDRLNTIISAAE